MSATEARAQVHARLLREWMADKGLKAPSLALAIERQGQQISPDYIRKLVRGERELSGMPLELREALRRALRVSATDWEDFTGLATAEDISPDVLVSPRRGPPIPSVVPFRQTRITIPKELLEMVEKHGDDFPLLRTERMQRMLAAPRAHGGLEVGPQTADDWFDYWMANKRFLT